MGNMGEFRDFMVYMEIYGNLWILNDLDGYLLMFMDISNYGFFWILWYCLACHLHKTHVGSLNNLINNSHLHEVRRVDVLYFLGRIPEREPPSLQGFVGKKT